MGCILQMQRRAIESLRGVVQDESLPPIKRNVMFFADNGNSLFPLGISIGIGTCSDIHGMNVVVLDEEKPADEYLWQQLRQDDMECEYAVLLLAPTEHERQHSTLCVERLRVVEYNSDSIIFSRTGIKRPYANI